MCVFSTHDLIRDPPFSKLDMVSCRNLLIYFEPRLQRRVIETFHYSLNAGGTLWLGPSETMSGSGQLFQTADKRARIFARKDGSSRARVGAILQPLSRSTPADPPVLTKIDDEAARIVALHSPPYVVLDARLEIQRFSGAVGQYLAPAEGRASLNLAQLLHSTLRAPARALIRRALATQSGAKEYVAFGAGENAGSVTGYAATALPANLAGIRRLAKPYTVTQLEGELARLRSEIG